tara:strand:+ start:1869 stop:2099 length:231 start_codon:yes stop_codon:yes gene_type:complete
MREFVKVEGHADLVKDTKTHAVINTNRNAYVNYKKRLQEAQRQRDEIRTATREINNIKCEMHEIKDMLKTLMDRTQ